MRSKFQVMLVTALLILSMGTTVHAEEANPGGKGPALPPAEAAESLLEPGARSKAGSSLLADSGEEASASKKREEGKATPSPAALSKQAAPGSKNEPKAKSQQGPAEDGVKEDTEDSTEAPVPASKEQKSAEGETPQATEEAETPKNPGNSDAPASSPEGEAGAEKESKGEGENSEESPAPKPEVDPQNDKELQDLENQITNETDAKKKAELQKEYNEKYLEALEKQGADKLDPETAKRLTEDEDITLYHQIQRRKKDLDKKKEAGTLTQKELDEFNQLLGRFQPPRKLSDEETKIKQDYKEKPYIHVDEKSITDEELQSQYKNYKKYKDALEKAFDPKGNGLTEAELQELGVQNLQGLKDAFDEAYNAVKAAVEDGDLKPSFGDEDGNPKVDVYPYDFTGSVNTDKPIKGDKHYYIPDGTPLDIFVQVGRKDDGKEITFTLTPEKVGNPQQEDGKDDGIKGRDTIILLNGDPIKLTQNEDGSYSFTTSNNFGVAQLKFTIPAIYGKLHEGFQITMQVGEKKITNQFLITKKGFDENPTTGSIGSTDPNKANEVDGGKTEDSKVSEYTDKVHDIFAQLKESDGYIDRVLVNSSNGESLPLTHVKITMKLPKNYDGRFAEYLYRSGLSYENTEEGTYVLELDTRDFGANLKEKDGKYYLIKEDKTEIPLTKAGVDDLKNALLEGPDGKTYIDENGEEHEVTTTEVQDVTVGETDYRIDKENKLYKKDAKGKYQEIGKFNEENGKKILKVEEKDGTTTIYEVRGKDLLIYTGVQDVYQGHVSNKKDDQNQETAAPTVTPTSPGNQVTIKENVDGKEKTSYGGTIVEDGVFDQTGSYLQKSDDTLSGANEALIDLEGKKYPGTFTLTVEEKKAGKKVIAGKTYKFVKDAVFNKEGYILGSYSYKAGLTLLDKFGRPMEGITVTQNDDGSYTFQKGEQSKTSDSTNLIVGTDEEPIFVNSKNYKEDGNYTAIDGKYYFDGTKFVAIKTKEDLQKVIGDKFYQDLTKGEIKTTSQLTYQEGKESKVVPTKDVTSYFGSKKKEDYYQAGGEWYAKQTSGETTIFVKKDGILSTDGVKRLVQVHKDYSITVLQETSILDAVNKAKFQIKFPGFLAGKNVVYSLQTEIIASYTRVGEDGQTEKVSIFKDKNGEPLPAEQVKTVNKYFTLKDQQEKVPHFFKNHPAALEKNLDYYFFNIFFRDEEDRERDAYISKLLETEKKSTTDALKKQNKKDLDLLKLLREALQKLTNNPNADFAFQEKDGKQVLKIVDKTNKTPISVPRTLVWKVGFNNAEGALFPEDSDLEITIEDHNMDNRLVYDEILLNNSKDKWEQAKNKWEAAEKEKKDKDATYQIQAFAGTDQYFYLDQVKRIILGVNPNYVDSRFVPAGEKFIITRDQIQTALKGDGKITLGKGDNQVTITVSKDEEKGQIKIKVLDAFYKKSDDTTSNFVSPTQEAYAAWLKKASEEAETLTTDTVDGFKSSFETFVKKTYDEKSDCFGQVKEKFEETLEKITNGPNMDENAKQKAMADFKAAFLAEIQKLQLAYLDPAKDDYHYDDMRFNALRIELEPGQSIGGAMDPSKTKYFGISSVLNPSVDVPYTDAFGKKLTNQGLYLQQEIAKILKEGITEKDGEKPTKFDPKNWDKKEETYRQVMTEALKRLHAKLQDGAENKITIKDLVEVKTENKDKVGLEKYTVRNGKDFLYSDFAIGEGENRESLKDKNGNPVNPYYVGDGTDENVHKIDDNIDELLKPYEGTIDKEDFKKTDRYKELTDPKIDLGNYYLHAQGHNRAQFANKANYKLNKTGQGPGIFGREDTWKSKICYPGIGQCIEIAGGNKTPGQEEEETAAENEQKAEDQFTISYSPSVFTPEEEKPQLNKTSETTQIDLSTDKDNDKKVDFTITLTVDKNKTEDKIAGNSTKPVDAEKEKEEAKHYNDRGYYVYKNALLIDFLPDIFRLTDNSSIGWSIDETELKANGANSSKDFDFAVFKEDAKPQYVEDIYKYVETLQGDQKTALQAAIAKAEKAGKISKTGNKQAIFVWLPEFEAPHGSQNPQFTLTLTNLLVDKKHFQAYNLQKGESYTNYAVFDLLEASHTITIRDYRGTVDKAMRIYDEKGNILNEGTAKEWFAGNASLHFGDSFDYRISYTHTKPGYVDINATSRDTDAELVDLFGSKDQNHGFRPVLREFLTLEDGFYATYRLAGTDETFYSEKEIQEKINNKEITLGDIIGVKIKNYRGFEINKEVEFVLPMRIPDLDAKIDEDGKVVYIGQYDEKHVLGDADKFFKLDKLQNETEDMFATNTVEKSNTVTVYLEKEAFLRVFKEFFDAHGEKITEGRPEVEFNIYQVYTDDQGKEIKVELEKKLVVNKDNNFTDQVDHLPLFKETTTIGEDGKVTVKRTQFSYKLEEVDPKGYESKVWTMDPFKKDENGTQLGFVWKAENTKKPYNPPTPPVTPPDNPPVNPPDNPPVNPPDNPPVPPVNPPLPPENPPVNPPENPPQPPVNPPVNPPEKPNTGFPDTGLAEDSILLYLSALAFALLLLARKKYAK